MVSKIGKIMQIRVPVHISKYNIIIIHEQCNWYIEHEIQDMIVDTWWLLWKNIYSHNIYLYSHIIDMTKYQYMKVLISKLFNRKLLLPKTKKSFKIKNDLTVFEPNTKMFVS